MSDPFTLDKIYQVLKDGRYKTDILCTEYLRNSYQNYEGKALDNEHQPLRYDIYIGTSACPQLIDEYHDFRHETIAKLFDDGIVPGFFAYKLNDTLISDAVAYVSKVLAICSRCEQFFGNHPFDNLHYIGGATGTKYCYIDFINYDCTSDFIDFAKDFFSSEDKVTSALYAPFSPLIKPIILKGPENLTDKLGFNLSDYIRMPTTP